MGLYDQNDRPLAVVELSLTAVVHDGDPIDTTSATVEVQITLGVKDLDRTPIEDATTTLVDRLVASIRPALRDILEGR